MLDTISFLKYAFSGILTFFSTISMFDKMNYLANSESIKSFLSAYETEKNVVKTKFNDIIVYRGKETKAAMIFYPGASVEYTAYEPLMASCAEKGIMSILFKMPLNFALFNIDAAKEVKSKFPEIKNWYIGGHSLGGVAAGLYASNHIDEFKGLIFFASFTINNFSKTNLKVLSIYGSEDKVLVKPVYNMFKKFFPSNFTEVVINGGCHSYFGMYGVQRGDGEPTISNEEQIEFTATQIAKLEDEE